MWRVTKEIIPFGYWQGKPILHLHAEATYVMDSEVRKLLITDTVYDSSIPVWIDSACLAHLKVADVIIIGKYRDVHLIHRADEHFEYPCAWRTVLAFDEAFYTLETLDGAEIIAEPHAPHLMEDILQRTHFSHYFVMPFDDETESEAKDFILSDKNTVWRITRRCFDGVTNAELERMMGHG